MTSRRTRIAAAAGVAAVMVACAAFAGVAAARAKAREAAKAAGGDAVPCVGSWNLVAAASAVPGNAVTRASSVRALADLLFLAGADPTAATCSAAGIEARLRRYASQAPPV